MSLLTHVVDWLVPFICGGVATVLGLMWRWGKAMVNAAQTMLGQLGKVRHWREPCQQPS